MKEKHMFSNGRTAKNSACTEGVLAEKIKISGKVLQRVATHFIVKIICPPKWNLRMYFGEKSPEIGDIFHPTP